MTSLPPAIILFGGALLVPALKGRLKAAWMLLVAAAALAVLVFVPEGSRRLSATSWSTSRAGSFFWPG